VATAVRSIFAQPDAESVRAQHQRVVDQLEPSYPEAARMLEEATEELLAFTACPKAHWKQIWSNNPQERLNKEIRRRTDVVGIFPNRDAILRLVGAVVAEQNDEWAIARRYMSQGVLLHFVWIAWRAAPPAPVRSPQVQVRGRERRRQILGTC
jgi:putative transposase